MRNGFAIAVAWPQTKCKQAGAWYDFILRLLRINKNGYYTVGHAAVVLVDARSMTCHYFDFGRYHAPHGYGRVRSGETDHDLAIKVKPIVKNGSLDNTDEILSSLLLNPSCHGDGILYAASARINFEKAYRCAIEFQEKEFLPYGPFVRKGTNCSRFVSSVIKKGNPGFPVALRLTFPATISPSPYWNVISVAGLSKIQCYDPQNTGKPGLNLSPT